MGEATSQIQLVSAEVCPFAQRSRLVLLEKKLSFELVEINLDNKPDWFTNISPQFPCSTGLVVPALARPEWVVEIEVTAVIPD